MPTQKLTVPFVKSAQHKLDPAKPKREKTIWWDSTMPGFGLCCHASGARAYVCQYRASDGTSRRASTRGDLSLKDAKAWAKGIMGQVARDHDPVQERRAARKAAKAVTKHAFDKIAAAYMRQGAMDKAGNRLRTAGEYQRIIDRYLLPKFKGRAITSIKRGEVGRHLDHIASAHGPVMADHCLKVFNRVARWHAARDDDFNPPLLAALRRTSIRERARTRTLSDDEIRALWAAAEALATPYSFMLRLVLLTATRLREASNATRAEFNAGGTEWTIPAERHKSKRPFPVPLSKAAQDILERIPVVGTKGWLFSHDGQVPINSFGDLKRDFDVKMLEELRKADPKAELPRWVTHDLRRSARSLMSRAGVPPRHAEAALGHAIPGVEGTYDRHHYRDEKRQAFEALADLVDRIVHSGKNVVELRTG